mmetsp:Transcript_18129/g.56731  ORF Transcript_18129/g.56731 Transcript_18129/m.56731 type:complete len:316 (-) Transcript_18129:514-1461(-)
MGVGTSWHSVLGRPSLECLVSDSTDDTRALSLVSHSGLIAPPSRCRDAVQVAGNSSARRRLWRKGDHPVHASGQPLFRLRRGRRRLHRRHYADQHAALAGAERGERGWPVLAHQVGKVGVVRPVQVAEQPPKVGVALGEDERRLGEPRVELVRHLPEGERARVKLGALDMQPAVGERVAQPAGERTAALLLEPGQGRSQVRLDHVAHEDGPRLCVQRHAPRGRGAAQQPVHEQQVGHQLEPAVVQHHHNLLAASRLERRAQLASVVGEHLAARVGQLGRVARAAAARRRVGGRDERRARGEGEVGEVAPQRGAHE